MRRRASAPAVLLLIAAAAAGQTAAQAPAPAATPVPAVAPTPAPTPVPLLDLRMLRLKISAGDLPSAESILETHRAEKGDDAEALLCVAWLARGAALLGDWPAASRWAKETRAAAESRLGSPPSYENNSEATYALGTAIEVEAQSLAAAGKKAEAIRLLDDSARARANAPYNLRARIQKRRNQLELVGAPAPGFKSEETLGAPFTSLESLRGKPVVLFFWWESCGDCRAQAPAVRKIVERYAGRGVAFVAPTRVYGDERAAERAKIEKTWRETYAMPDSVSAPISDEAMVRYGVSATPTFAFVDRKGVVRRYLPYRMTEERLAAAIEELLKE
jgi:thiol-disulfide isomerase/thioredoxin